MRFRNLILLSTCLAILHIVPFAYAQETQTVLKPNQLVTFSLATKQEKVFVLQMKKGDFAEIQSLAREGLNLSFEIYDSARKELFYQFGEWEDSVWFVAPRDGEFLLVSKLAKEQYSEISGVQKLSIQYNNKFSLPARTKLKGVRKVNGFDVKIMTTPESQNAGGNSILLVEKNGQLQKVMKQGGNGPISGFSFFGDEASELSRELRTTRDKTYRSHLIEQLKSIQLINSTPDKTGDGVPDIMIGRYTGGNHCCTYTYFIDLGDTVKVYESPDWSIKAIGKDTKGGLRFETSDNPLAFWFTSGCGACARPSAVLVILEFRFGKLRPNFELMKKPPPSLVVLRATAQKFHNQLSLKPYKGAKDLNALEHDPFSDEPPEDPGLFSKEYLDDESTSYKPPMMNCYSKGKEFTLPIRNC